MTHFKPVARVVGAAAIALSATACDDFLRVDNPTVIEASTIDPVADAPTFANSALNNFYIAADNVAVYQAWFTGEAWVGDTFPTRNDIAKRQIDFNNGTLSGEVFNPLARAVASGERTLELLAEATAGATTSLNVMRASFASGYAIQFMAETFCEVVISSGLGEKLGSPISPLEGSVEAADRFRAVIAAAAAATPGAENTRLLNGARVGLARALLFQKDYAGAIAAATQVTDGFEYIIPRIDDPSNRGSLGNTVFSFSRDRPSLVVPPYLRALNDSRIESAVIPPLLKTQGNDLDFFRQLKYPDYGADIRLASKLEARYIIAEARLKQGSTAEALALIAERQAVDPDAGEGNDFADNSNPVLTELLDQRARDFYLEAQHMGTWLRNGAATPYVYRAGDPYYAEAGSTIGTQTCMPIPANEVQNNPNFP